MIKFMLVMTFINIPGVKISVEPFPSLTKCIKYGETFIAKRREITYANEHDNIRYVCRDRRLPR